jgi:hypothetical protein
MFKKIAMFCVVWGSNYLFDLIDHDKNGKLDKEEIKVFAEKIKKVCNVLIKRAK